MNRVLPIRPKRPTIQHAGELPARADGQDPRGDSFSAQRVDVDLRECAFVRPPAMLWCMVYLALARTRDVRCRLLVPEHPGASIHLKSVGLFDALKRRGVEVDDRDVYGDHDGRIVLPVEPFQISADATALTNRAFGDQRVPGVNRVADGLRYEQGISRLFREEMSPPCRVLGVWSGGG